jgi:thiamine-phosphate pyrophosphorylase
MYVALITQERFLNNEIPIINEMLSGGLNYLHVRKPGSSKREYHKFLDQIKPQYLDRLVLHEHQELCTDSKINIVQFTKRQWKKDYFKMWLLWKYLHFKKPGLECTYSFHEMSTLLKDRSSYRHVFLSPVFDSISKPGYESKFNNSFLVEGLKKTKHTVFALGGIDESKIEIVRTMGFAGVGLKGAVWLSADPLKKFQIIFQKCQAPILSS